MELVTVLLTRSHSSKETTLAGDTVGTEAETADGFPATFLVKVHIERELVELHLEFV
jgi:hypothetical protein